MKEKILTILTDKEVKLCVISTVSKEGQPWSAVVGYALEDDGTIVISTHTNSRKWHNIGENNNVSLVFGFSFTEPNIQSEGVATLITDGEDFQKLQDFFYSVNPHAKQFKTDDTAFISIRLTMARLTDLSVSPPKVDEVSFT